MYLSIRYNFRAARRRPAFTLIELMISIGLIVILMLGINQVFKMSSDAVGAGQTLSAMTRDSRAAATILQDDARMWVKDSPIFYIRMERDPSGLRRDYMAFFARGSYHRHTAQGGAFSSPTTSAEAYIWFGHLFAPGTNVFLSRNIVGRTCILLKDPAMLGTEQYLVRNAPVNGIPDMSPLSSSSKAPQQNGPPLLAEKRIWQEIDLAGTTIDMFRKDLQLLKDKTPAFDGPTSTWWRPPGCELVFRFQATSSGSVGNTKYLPAQRLSLAAPIFMENVTELVIEYAGDYLTQDWDTGAMVAPQPDGVLDFAVVDGVHRTRWYGLPRADDPTAVPLYAFLSGSFAAFERETTATRYTCLWTNGSPRLVRMLMKVEDPAQRIQGGQWYEYILGPQ